MTIKEHQQTIYVKGFRDLSRGACVGRTDVDFFPNNVTVKYTAARELCVRCPVRDDCLEEAMDLEGSSVRQSRHGMLGGLTPGERYILYGKLQGGRTLEDEDIKAFVSTRRGGKRK